MSSEEASCSDCRLEVTQIRWTQLLLNWINKCIFTKKKANQINMKTLNRIIKKYKDEVSADATDKALLTGDNLELLIMYKFPIARLEHLSEEKDMPKKLYIMASILLYYCCINSRSGKVDADICRHLDAREQEMIIRFCEVLSECEVTVNNIDNAIEEACATTKALKKTIRTDCEANENNTPKTTNEFDSIHSSRTSRSSRTKTIVPEEKKKVTIQENVETNTRETPVTKFKASVTVLPSVVTDTSSYSKSSMEHFSDVPHYNCLAQMKRGDENDEVIEGREAENDCCEDFGDQNPRCQPECACTRCSVSGPCCGDPDSSMDQCKVKPKKHVRLKDFKDSPTKRVKYLGNWKLYLVLIIGVLLAVLLTITLHMIPDTKQDGVVRRRRGDETVTLYPGWAWQCKDNVCRKVFQPASNNGIYISLSRCSLLCSGPQIWPYPIGSIHFSKTIVALSTKKLEYKFQATPSDTVHQYLAEAYKLFIKDLIALEKMHLKPKNLTEDLTVMKMSIRMEVESDADPRMRINTDETYAIKLESKKNLIVISLSAASFCGLRHGFETLSQMILLDQASGYLITLSSATIKDGPSYKYRGLMIDTGRNFIPVTDLIRTIDGMAACKLNTFHWRISDATSFPLHIARVPELLEFGPYDRSMIYTKEDVKAVVYRAGVRGIRVLIEVAMPGPVGRPWVWSPQASCLKKNDNRTCDNILCLRLELKDALFDKLQLIYAEILELTKVDDIFHLSDGVFSLSNCFHILEDRERFLEKALERLKLANGGFLPKLPIIWYTSHLIKDFVTRSWERYGVQIHDWNYDYSDQFLSNFKVIYSSKWDLSCQMKKKQCVKYRTWQEMYTWKSWCHVEVFTVEGGEAMLWTDLVNSGNLDYHLWPRAAAVAERLWSDAVANSSATSFVYTRLDTHREWL